MRKRLISRRRQGDDRREVRLDLTVSGRHLVDRVTATRRAEIERILTNVPATKRKELVEAFAAFGHAAGEIPDAQWTRSWDL